MPRDRRLWVKVSTDIGRNPKMSRLSDAAFRAYVEALAHAKELNRDGLIPERDARRWMPEFMELLSNDVERPSVIAVADGFQIHDYTEHQETAEKVERRRAASRENGSKGGRPPKPRNLDANPASPPSVKAESRVQSLPTKTYTSQSSNERAREGTDSEFTSDTARALASQAGIKNPASLAKLIRERTQRTVHWDHLGMIVRHLVSKSAEPVRSGQAYAAECLRNDPMEVQQFIDESGIAA